MLDPCHMCKLARNALANLGSMLTTNQQIIHWHYISSLHNAQEYHGLKLGNKLTSNHINFQKHKMKVNLAAQNLSSSVADAIDFMNVVHKNPQFQDSETTITFIRTVDKLFDILNSRNALVKGFKKPLNLASKASWEIALRMIADYLLSLK